MTTEQRFDTDYAEQRGYVLRPVSWAEFARVLSAYDEVYRPERASAVVACDGLTASGKN